MNDWPAFLIEYRHDGETFGAEIRAPSHEDAQRRLRSIGVSGGVLGEIHLKVTVGPREVHGFGIGLVAGALVAALFFGALR